MPFEEDSIHTMEIHQPKLYARIVQSMLALEANEAPPEPLSFFEDDKVLNASRFLLVVTDPFHIELNSKKNLSALYTKIENLLISDMEQYALWGTCTQRLWELIDKQLKSLNVETAQNDEVTIIDYCRAVGLKFDFGEQQDLYHKLLGLMDIIAEFMPDRVLILCNIRSFLTSDELREIYKYATYIKIRVLHIEQYLSSELMPNEIRWVIDEEYEDYIVRGQTV